MAKHIRSKKQVRADRAALKKLKSTGILKSADVRKAPTKYQRGLINKYQDVIKGRAAVVKPADPKSYKGLFSVVGDKVIVPRRKGEAIKTTPKGAIVSERKVGGRKIKSYFRRVKTEKDLSDKKRTMFFVPFIRGRDAKGKPILEWKRFPSKDVLLQIMGGYETKERNPYTDWQNYVIEETVSVDAPYTVTPELDKKLSRKLGNKKRRKIKFDDDEGEE